MQVRFPPELPPSNPSALTLSHLDLSFRDCSNEMFIKAHPSVGLVIGPNLWPSCLEFFAVALVVVFGGVLFSIE